MKKLILMGCFLFASHAFAEPAAKVLFTAEKVMLNHNGAERALSRGATLEPGDQITTLAKAIANIQYSNGTLVNIGSDSTYKILAYAPKEDVQIKAELTNGKIEIQNPGKIKETLKTPIVSLAILGTHINVDVTSAKMTYVQVIEGLVLARNEYLRPGDSVRVTPDKIINAPFPKEGLVNSPLNSPGKIEASADSTITATETTASASGGASVVTYATTTQIPGAASGGGTQAIIDTTSVIELTLSCN